MQNKLVKILLTGFLQVLLVSFNTYQIAVYSSTDNNWILINLFLVGFGISLVWSYNVKRISIGTGYEGTLYAVGAGLGTVVGCISGQLFKSVIDLII